MIKKDCVERSVLLNSLADYLQKIIGIPKKFQYKLWVDQLFDDLKHIEKDNKNNEYDPEIASICSVWIKSMEKHYDSPRSSSPIDNSKYHKTKIVIKPEYEFVKFVSDEYLGYVNLANNGFIDDHFPLGSQLKPKKIPWKYEKVFWFYKKLVFDLIYERKPTSGIEPVVDFNK